LGTLLTVQASNYVIEKKLKEADLTSKVFVLRYPGGLKRAGFGTKSPFSACAGFDLTFETSQMHTVLSAEPDANNEP